MAPPSVRVARRALIVGCGDVGCRLALRLVGDGVDVTGLVRTDRSAAALRSLGIAALIADLDAPIEHPIRVALARFDDLYHFAPPPKHGLEDLRTAHLLAALASSPKRLIYLSTSAVYGDCEGRWIDETAPLLPKSERGVRRLAAERAVLAYAAANGCDAMILRVPGIYGPGRLPVERLRKGTPILRLEDSPFTNRIHADDLAEAARRVAEAGRPGAAYNVSDGQPSSMTDYFLRCARLLGLPAPPQVPLAEARSAFSPMLLSFLEESRRLSNRRLVETLGWRPGHPELEAGLAASIRDDRVSASLRRAA